MALAENGERSRPPLVDLAHKVGQGFDLVRRHPIQSIELILAIAGAYTGMSWLGHQVDLSNEQNAQKVAAREMALKVDYDEKGGVDLLRKQVSYIVTLRESARLAGSEAALIDNAWSRVKIESGCEPIQTVTLRKILGDRSKDQDPNIPVPPTTYLIGIKC